VTKVPWLADRKAAWRPVPYCHLGFTVPHARNPLIVAHQRPLFTLLCTAASHPLVQGGPRHLGGPSGGTMGLQTWAQTWGAHCHGHCRRAAGARSANGPRWIAAAPRCLLPGRALRPVLRGQCCAALLPGGATALRMTGLPSLGTPADGKQLRAQLDAKDWGGYAQAPLAAPAHGWDDGGRSTPRVAMAKHRRLDVRDGGVGFASRSRRQGHRGQTMTLDADACIRRVLLPVWPRGCMRLRP
jgi:Putative transposase